MRQDRYRFWIHLKEIDMYLKVERQALFGQAQFSYPSVQCNALGSSHYGKKIVWCCCCSPLRRIPRHRPTQKERARPPRPVGPLTSSEELSLNWRTEVTFVTILPTANTCPVQRERAAQTNVSCYTESPAGHRGPSGKAMICRGADHSFFYWGQVHERQLQTSHILADLPFRWHQRDQAKVRNFVSRLLHSAAVY